MLVTGLLYGAHPERLFSILLFGGVLAIHDRLAPLDDAHVRVIAVNLLVLLRDFGLQEQADTLGDALDVEQQSLDL